MTAELTAGGPDTSAELVALRSPTGTALIAATVLASMVGFLDVGLGGVIYALTAGPESGWTTGPVASSGCSGWPAWPR